MSDHVGVLFVGPDRTCQRPVPAGDVAELVDGLMHRNAAANSGRCPCGGAVVMPNRAERRSAARQGRRLHGRVEHAPDCPAVSSAVVRFAGGSDGGR